MVHLAQYPVSQRYPRRSTKRVSENQAILLTSGIHTVSDHGDLTLLSWPIDADELNLPCV